MSNCRDALQLRHPAPGLRAAPGAPWALVPAVVLMLLALAPGAAIAKPDAVIAPVAFAISPPMRSVGPVAQPRRVGAPELEDQEINELNDDWRGQVLAHSTPVRDAALQSRYPVTRALSTPSVSFEGLNNFTDNGAAYGFLVNPPDTNGDVGPNHYVEATNLLIRVFDKAGNALGTFKQTALFTALGGVCATFNPGDPIVLYDQMADRWLVSQFNFLSTTAPPWHECVAISKTGDPLGAYYLYDFQTSSTAGFPDYPHLGVWPDGYYLTVRQFLPAAGTQCGFSSTFNNPGAYAFDRVKMLNGDPTASAIYFNLAPGQPNGLSTCEDGMLPSDLDGLTPPPAGRANTHALMTADEYGDPQNDSIRLFDFHADFAVPANSTFTERAESPFAVAAFDPIAPGDCTGTRRDVPQPPPAGATQNLDVIERILHRLQYRNFGGSETLVVNHTVNAGTSLDCLGGGSYKAGIRYYEFRRTLPAGTFTLPEQATYSPDANHRWMGSAAMDGHGNLAVGYSVVSTTVFPSIRYAARDAADAAGGLFQGEQTLIAGTGEQTTTNNRWGDYTALSVDPVDDCTFWYANEYYTAASQATSSVGWLTRIGSFTVSSCTPVAQGTLAGTITDCASGTPISNAMIVASGGPSSQYSATSIVNGTYSRTLSPGTYSVTIADPTRACAVAGPFNVTITAGQTTTLNQCLNGSPNFQFVSAGVTGGNGNGTIDFNECDQLNLSLKNFGCAPASNVTVALSSSTPGVSFTQPNSPLPNTAIDGSSGNTVPFSISTTPSFGCVPIQVSANISFTGGSQVLNFTLPSCAGVCATQPGPFSDAITNTDPFQTGRLGRDGLAPTCGAAKQCPGNFNTLNRLFDNYSVTNNSGAPACVTVSLAAPTCGAAANQIFASVYKGSFSPTANLCANWVADAGVSPSATTPSTFSFTADPNGTYVLDVTAAGALTSGTTLCGAYTLTVSGLQCGVDGGGQCTPCALASAPNITVANAAGACNQAVTFSTPAPTGTCGPVSCVPASGAAFPVGTTAVNCTATAGTTTGFNVIVNDTELPVITCPGNQTSPPADPFLPAPTFSDNCPAATVACTPPIGSLVPGATTENVNCTATDASANTAQCSYSFRAFAIAEIPTLDRMGLAGLLTLLAMAAVIMLLRRR